MKEGVGRKSYIFCAVTAALSFVYFVSAFLESLSSMGQYAANPDSEALGNRVASVVSAVSSYQVFICIISALAAVGLGILVCRCLMRKEPEPFLSAALAEAVLYGLIFVSFGDLPNGYTDYGFNGLNLSFLNRAYLFLFGLLSCFCLKILKDRPGAVREAFKGKLFRVLWALSSFWISFSLVGKPLFMPHGRTPWSITSLRVTVFIMFLLWIQPVLAALLTALSEIFGKKAGVSKAVGKETIKTGLSFFLVFSLVWLLYLIACNPGNISLDAVMAWQEIVGDRALSSLFPPLIKIFYMPVCRAIPSVYIIGIVQILLMSLLSTAFAMFLYRQGFGRKGLLLGSIIFAIFPSNGIFVVTFTSNFYYMLCMCALTLCVLEFFVEGSATAHRKTWYAALGLSIYGLYFMRNEGRYMAVLAGLVLFIAALKNKSLKQGVAVICPLAGILITSFLVFPAFGTGNGEIQSFDYWRNVLWSAAYYGGELPEKAKSYDKAFEKFTEGDFNYNGCPPEEPEVLSRGERMDAVRYVVVNDFPEVLRDRLNKSDVVWDVTEAEGAHNVREIIMVVPGPYGFERRDNIFTAILVKGLYPLTIAIAPLDCICYRSGIWIDLALMLILLFVSKNRKRYVLALTPVLIHSLVFMAGLMWQCSRHVYVTSLCVLMVVLTLPVLDAGKAYDRTV